jgi:hypothetical protein
MRFERLHELCIVQKAEIPMVCEEVISCISPLDAVNAVDGLLYAFNESVVVGQSKERATEMVLHLILLMI